MGDLKIPHSRPTIGPNDPASMAQVLKTDHLAQGKKVLEFENKMRSFCHVKGAVAVNSGTSALHLSLLALNVGQGDEVIAPSYVCSAPLNAILYTGAIPKIVDVNPDDFNISPAQAKKHINKKTKAVIVPHMFGYPADMKGLLRLGVPIIEDCAQSIGARYQGQMAGSLGTLSVCSFYATKVMTTGEGGMVLSNQAKLLEKVRDLREYDNASFFKVRYNYKMTDMQAALGTSQLSQLPIFIKRRKEIAQAYDLAFAGLAITTPYKEAGRDHIYYRYVIKIGKGQKGFLRKLKDRGIQAAAPVFKPLHRYLNQKHCPVSDQLMEQCLSVPIYPTLTNNQVRYIISCMQDRP